MVKIEKMQACKPGSVPRKRGFYHLSAITVACNLYLPTHCK